jgi:predicted AAA+ superfamily ATPase
LTYFTYLINDFRLGIEIVKIEVAAWQRARNNKSAKVNWQFIAEDARIKLRRLYPTLDG